MHRQNQKAHTLRRGGLKKPVQQFQEHLQRNRPSANPERELRAKLTPKHHSINRFGIPRVVKRNAHTRPAAEKALSGELMTSHQPATVSSASKSVPAPVPSLVTSVSHQKLERLLDEALAKADSHKQALRYHAARHFWHRRWFSGARLLVSAFILFLIVVSALALSWQRVPFLSVKMAGLRTHLSASIPQYQPDGYKLAGPAKAVSGAVSIQYKSTADASHTYEIRQTQSNLTSSLISQNVVPKGATVQTSQVQGNSVYIYGPDNDVAWVNNGVLYTIVDHANLSSDELIKIVQGINQ